MVLDTSAIIAIITAAAAFDALGGDFDRTDTQSALAA
jgi:hypothetical protein